ncbi:uncharacterized protein LOC114176378 [Vigna unguiculata]|uniref:GRF-type domain-containing protein n=1 Tax=Vigna unguiculata TaxID=3917 RepID=A0A4D6KWR8_VIGUN|nr:uncharacterized protein LOC114176378 [Vigna unguiculata]QCD79839.1 hypothetical protein DEO72_LG2g157 [Vigna unguiculata]
MSCGFSHPLSSCSCGSHNHSVSSPGIVSGSVSGTPHCNCGEIAVLRVARTAKNCGKQFWGCPHYKRSVGEDFKACNYFKWWTEDNGDERDATIARQSQRIRQREKDLIDSEKWLMYLFRIIGLLGLIVIVLSICIVKS